MKKTEEYFKNQEESLYNKAKAAGIFDSSTSKGSSREGIIKEFLVEVLPNRISIECGEVIDSYDRSSGEIDIILVDRESNAYRVGGRSLVPVEASVGIIEVKSNLSGHLEEAVLKICRAKQLIRVKPLGFILDNSKIKPKIDIPPKRTNGYIFAYDGPKWDTIANKLKINSNWYNNDYMNYGPDIICILKKGFLYKNDFHYLKTEPDYRHLENFWVDDEPGIRRIIFHVQETINRYGKLSYEIGAY